VVSVRRAARAGGLMGAHRLRRRLLAGEAATAPEPSLPAPVTVAPTVLPASLPGAGAAVARARWRERVTGDVTRVMRPPPAGREVACHFHPAAAVPAARPETAAA
jgi:hypothetical protein